MSELAFNLAGEPFEVPSAAIGWRVRKLKPKGAPEVVYGRDGTPLILPIDADMEDLRREARTEGRYRLDPLDDQNRTIANAPAGYVCLHPVEHVAEPAPPPSPVPQGPDYAVVEAMRMNTELARTIVDRFPAMLDSAAGLLRAADGAGLPAREPRALPEFIEDDDELDDDRDIEEVPPKATGWTGLLETLLPLIAPAIVNAIASGKVQIPGGVGALLDCRRASTKAGATGARTASTPGVATASGPRDPAPVRRSTSVAREATAGAERAGTPAVARHSTPATQESTTHEATTNAAHAAHAEPATTAASATESTTELPTLDPAALAHFAAIQGVLTFREGMLARALAAELPPAELRTWLAELRTLSVPEAVTKIRGVLGSDGSDGSDNTTGGAS